MTKNNNKEVQYIWHDGVRIREDQLISMAKRASTYEEAKCYIISLMAHGLVYGLYDYINKVNEIRVHHHVSPMPLPEVDCVSINKDEVGDKSEDTARKMYMMMEMGMRKKVVMLSVITLYENHPEMFRSKNDWIGIYLVIRDRVNGNLSKSEFAGVVINVIPDWWPKHLMINGYTMSNFARCLDYNDRFEAYYDMDNNPWDGLCNTFWEILKQQILTNK